MKVILNATMIAFALDPTIYYIVQLQCSLSDSLVDFDLFTRRRASGLHESFVFFQGFFVFLFVVAADAAVRMQARRPVSQEKQFRIE